MREEILFVSDDLTVVCNLHAFLLLRVLRLIEERPAGILFFVFRIDLFLMPDSGSCGLLSQDWVRGCMSAKRETIIANEYGKREVGVLCLFRCRISVLPLVLSLRSAETV